MIAIPIVGATPSEALQTMEKAEAMADCIEIRLDLIPRDVWLSLLKRKKRPSIVTLRPVRQGGAFEGEEISRIRLLEEALGYDPDFIDVEWDTPPHLFGSLMKKKGDKTGFIVSYHNHSETPDNLDSIVKEVLSRGGDITKIATTANDFDDNIRILRLTKRLRAKTIALCMGSFGIPSRILTLREGGYLTFGAVEDGKGSAPGQISARELREIYRADQIRPKTRVFGLVGNPISHSLSPVMHNAAFQAVGYDAVYLPFQVNHFGNLMAHLAAIGVVGFSVTIPYKERIISSLDGVDAESDRMGAVNTVYRRDGSWFGTNTDVHGAWKALEETGTDHKGKRWTILGSGGVARAIACCAEMHGTPKSLTVIGRKREKLERFLDDLRRNISCPLTGTIFAEADLGKILGETDIIVNATPVGMAPHVGESLIHRHLLRPTHLVFDTVYNPIQTQLLKDARKQGCRIASGFQMFLHQGVAQFERWTGRPAPFTLMEEEARGRLTQ
ncbi:MAG: shikimate dehydrogenase [Proteobacteria bacterium]|nr:shikimate dehydrogenase [Pseudomonadota bacterium]